MHDAGAGVFLCKASRAVREVLVAAPRHAIHRALTQSHAYLGTPATSGISADLEDVCIAFQTFDEVSSLEQPDHLSAWDSCNTSIATFAEVSREGMGFTEGHPCMLHSHNVAKLRENSKPAHLFRGIRIFSKINREGEQQLLICHASKDLSCHGGQPLA